MGPTVLLVEAPPGGSVWDADLQRGITALAERLSRDPRMARVTGFPDVVAAVPAGLQRCRADRRRPSRALRPLARDVVSPDSRMAMRCSCPRAPGEPGVPGARPTTSGVTAGPSSTASRYAWPSAARRRLTADFDEEVFGGLRLAVVLVLGVTFLSC